MALQRVQALLPLGVPHLDHVVVRAGHHQPAVVLDAAHRRQVADEHVQTGALVDVPDAQRRVPGTADDSAK